VKLHEVAEPHEQRAENETHDGNSDVAAINLNHPCVLS
jgi:hypothetical protein